MRPLTLKCSCGLIAWNLVETIPRRGIRYTCHCDDCQVFAHFTGRRSDVLDVNGGTDVYQLPSSRIQLLKGGEHLASIQVTSRPLLRWYCRSCKMPVANTYHTSKLSFVSIPLCGAPASQRSEVLGPSSGHVWTKFGRGDLSNVKQCSIPAMLARIACRIIAARLSGDYRNNPFFVNSGKPVAPPCKLNLEERHALEAAVLGSAQEPS